MSKTNKTAFHVGTSGYSYKEWKGTFYPEKISPKEMLDFYGEQFTTVEINNSFYAMPKPEVLKAWVKQVPDEFSFVLKCPQTVTHYKRLNNVKDEITTFRKVASVLKNRLGPLLFQLPPNFKKDVERLDKFLKLVGNKVRVAMEFRHESWFDEEVYTLLKSREASLCFSDADDLPAIKLMKTADWGYMRFRRENYTDAALRKWIEKIRAIGWNDAYIFFKHEDACTGPKFAKRFLKFADAN